MWMSFGSADIMSGRNSAPPIIKSTPTKAVVKPTSIPGIKNAKITPKRSPRPKTASTPVKNTLLDESINKVAQSEPFNGSPEIQRVSEGK